MATTRQDIGRWFDSGRDANAAYMVVICDTFDYDDYPVYFNDIDSMRRKVADPGSMQRVMEVYDLNGDREAQLSADRAWAL